MLLDNLATVVTNILVATLRVTPRLTTRAWRDMKITTVTKCLFGKGGEEIIASPRNCLSYLVIINLGAMISKLQEITFFSTKWYCYFEIWNFNPCLIINGLYRKIVYNSLLSLTWRCSVLTLTYISELVRSYSEFGFFLREEQ